MILELRPGETREQFIARIVAASRPPTPEELADLRRLLPPVPAEHRKAA